MNKIIRLHCADRPGGFGARRHFPDALPRTQAHAPARLAGQCPPIDAQVAVYRLEEAGTTLLCLPNTGHSTRLRTSSLDVITAALDGTSWGANADSPRLRPMLPDSSRIDRMDEAFGWLALIPQDRYVLRRIVGARALVSPTTERHLFSWRRLGTAMGADHKAVQRWHAQGIGMIVAGLAR